MTKFVMLIGLPGAGKSQYAEHLKSDLHLNSPTILSSDAIRKEIYGDETIQDKPEKVFELMRQRTVTSLNEGRDVVYDATNISRKKRRHLLSQLPPCDKIACVIWAKYETCIKRDATRERSVGKSVIKRMLMNFQPPYFDEGWDRIEFKMNDTPYTRYDYDDWLDCEHDNPHHNNTVKEHTLRVMTAVSNITPARYAHKGLMDTIRISAALHDIGKKFVKSFKDSRGNPCEIAHFYSHHNVGSYFAIGYEEVLGLDIKKRAMIVWLINVHMEPFFNSKYYTTLRDDLKSAVNILHKCDVEGA